MSKRSGGGIFVGGLGGGDEGSLGAWGEDRGFERLSRWVGVESELGCRTNNRVGGWERRLA